MRDGITRLTLDHNDWQTAREMVEKYVEEILVYDDGRMEMKIVNSL